METEKLIAEELDDETVEQLRAESIAVVRDLILKGHPDLVPDLVRGETLAELMDSVEPARAAYQRIVETVRAEARAAVPVVPAGGVSPVSIEGLSAGSLIKRGLEQARRAS